MKTTKTLLQVAILAGWVCLLAACHSSRNSNQPWDKPVQENNYPGYNSPNPFPLDRGTGQNAGDL